MATPKHSRRTQSKKAISDLFEQSSVALSHADIESELDGLCNRVTIYRVLDRLVDEGVIHKLMDVDGVAKYMACIDCLDDHSHHHLHFSCQSCGQVSCLHHVVPSFKLPSGYVAVEANFTVSGTCANCTTS